MSCSNLTRHLPSGHSDDASLCAQINGKKREREEKNVKLQIMHLAGAKTKFASFILVLFGFNARMQRHIVVVFRRDKMNVEHSGVFIHRASMKRNENEKLPICCRSMDAKQLCYVCDAISLNLKYFCAGEKVPKI